MSSPLSSNRLAEWNQRFGLPGLARIVAGAGGLARIEITSPSASADIYVQGAHLTSWKPHGAEDVIFLSSQSKFEPGKAIRGGIPVCFPWFRAKADDPGAPAHGFARTSEWAIESIGEDGDRVSIVLKLTASEATRHWWPHEFEAHLRVLVGARLTLEFAVKNTGELPFRFEEALHTYHRVGDAARMEIDGLDGVSYLDNRDGNRVKVQQGAVAFAGPTDNAYEETTGALEIADPVLKRRVKIDKHASLSTVVWNPWQEGAAGMADLGSEEWREFGCVEAANILNAAVTLSPGEEHAMKVEIAVAPMTY